MSDAPNTDPAPAAASPLAGVDVSSYQGGPSTWRPEAGSIRWAAVKLTELQPGNVKYVNPEAAADWDYLGKNKLGRVGYLFGHPSVGALATVEFFTSELRGLGLSDPDAVMLDLEVTDGLPPAKVDAWAADVLGRLENRLHRKPLLYTYLSFAQAGNTASLGKYPLWISDPSSPMGHPRVPAPWKTWAIHQYSISGAIDRDVANYSSLTAMGDALGKPKGQQVEHLGGNITGDLTAVRWDNGIMVVAGRGTDGFVYTKRYHSVKKVWGPWRKVSLSKTLGTAGLVAWGNHLGYLYYTEESGAVIQLQTSDSGATWT